MLRKYAGRCSTPQEHEDGGPLPPELLRAAVPDRNSPPPPSWGSVSFQCTHGVSQNAVSVIHNPNIDWTCRHPSRENAPREQDSRVMSAIAFIVIYASALRTGWLIGAIGVGGVLLVPLLVLVGGMDVAAATPVASFSFLFTGLAGAVAYARGTADCPGRRCNGCPLACSQEPSPELSPTLRCPLRH